MHISIISIIWRRGARACAAHPSASTAYGGGPASLSRLASLKHLTCAARVGKIAVRETAEILYNVIYNLITYIMQPKHT